MSKPSLEDIGKVLTELVFPFAKIERDLPLPGKNGQLENDAEHSWSIALVASMLAERIDPNLDIGRVCQLAVVHDLVEVFAGDTSIWDNRGRASKRKREEQALLTIKTRFKSFPWLWQTIQEYEARESNEAKFVSAIDKLLATYVRYIDEDSRPSARYFIHKRIDIQRFRQATEQLRRKAAVHPTVGSYYKELMGLFELHPDWFSQS